LKISESSYTCENLKEVYKKKITMGWLRRLFRAVSREEMMGIHLDTTGPYWETPGPRDCCTLFQALQGWLPPNAVLYFEGGSPDAEINEFMAAFSIPELTHVAMGTVQRKGTLVQMQL